MKFYHYFQLMAMATLCALIISCGNDDDDNDDDMMPDGGSTKLITSARLTFRPPGGGMDVIYEATDPEGQNLSGPASIRLSPSTTYTLTMVLVSDIGPDRDVTMLVENEAEDHQFFFQWDNDFFESPEGNGNYDNPRDEVDYVDFDDNELPVGLTTTWSTGVRGPGNFNMRLQHQPEIKSETSTVNDGVTDLDLNFSIEIGN